jgi:putative flippase GtrA
MIARQAASFALIGLAVNAAVYVGYILLTLTLLSSVAAMTVTYCSGVIMSFLLNRRFAFGFEGEKSGAFIRYACVYFFGYLINFAGLLLLVQGCGLPHEVAQGWMIVGIAALMFFLQKYWVFKDRHQSRPARFTSPSQ